jgi:membrane protease YdiL (CAAX protease family)
LTTDQAPQTKTLSRGNWLVIELGVMVALCVIPPIWSAIQSQLRMPTDRLTAPLWDIYVGRTFIYLRRLVPAMFVVWGSGDGLETFGFRRFKAGAGVAFAIGGIVLIAILAFAVVGVPAASPRESPAMGHVQFNPAITLLAVGSNVLRFIVEEFTLRGYLLNRLQEITGNRWFPALATSCLYALFHVNEGQQFVLAYLILGFYFAWSYRVTRSIWPAVLPMTTLSVASILFRLLR